MRLLHDEAPVGELLEQHKAVLEYERFVKTHTWVEVEAAYPGEPPSCDCVICQQLEAFSDKLVTIMRELRIHENAPDVDGPRMETLMHDLVAFSEASERTDFTNQWRIRNASSSRG